MAEDKKFYWIKLKDAFMTSDTVDFLMGQKNGSQYVVLYQMICLKTINTNGELAKRIGEIIVPFNAEKIHRDCRYFDIDTIIVALELYKKLGLIYEQKDGNLKIANFENMIGSETVWAEKKRLYRSKDSDKLEKGQKEDIVLDDFRQEIDIRDKSKILDIKKKDIHSISQKESKIDSYFDTIWQLYPRKVNKVQGFKNFSKKFISLSEEESKDRANKIYSMLSNQLTRWSAENDGEGRKVEFIPHFSTWLNSNIEDSKK